MKIGKNRFSWTWINISLSKNKSFEYQLDIPNRYIGRPFDLSLNWISQCDHAGITFTFGIHNLIFLELKIYDKRHWSYEKNTYAE